MIGPRHVLSAPLAAAMLMSAVAAPSAEGYSVEPYKLVRSLQRIQDEIADGDKSALGMQFELSKLIDESFAKLQKRQFSEPQNARALIAYAMLGGNPATLESHLTDLGGRDSELVRLGVAVLLYQKGAAHSAASRLKAVDPVHVGGMFGASLALVRGLVTQDDEVARGDFDIARLLAPGTLIEEAALRRLMTIHRRRQDPHSFLRVASRYARRYVASPYAMQFAQEFTAGVIALGHMMDMAEVMEIIEFMPEPYRSAVTVRLMRNATVEGKPELVARIAALEPAIEMQPAESQPLDQDTEARQQFYAKIAQITSENVTEVAAELSRIDPSSLSEGDRGLLGAVLAIANAVTDPEPLVSAAAPAPRRHDSIFYDSPKEQTEPVLSDFDDFVGGTRSALENVDKLLEDIR